jgi:hypothetical protein
VLHLEHSFVRYWNLNSSACKSEKLGNFLNMVLEMYGEEQFDYSCEKWSTHRVKEEWNVLHTIKRG